MNSAQPLYAAGILQTKAYRILQARVNDCLQMYGLNHGQWVLLGVVADAEKGIRLNATAKLLGVKAPLVTAMANTLIAEGYLERLEHQHDRRAKLLLVSGKGNQLLQKVQQDLRSVLNKLLDGLSSEELETYHKVLMTIIANAERTI